MRSLKKWNLKFENKEYFQRYQNLKTNEFEELLKDDAVQRICKKN